ncbi:22330_t:CDS:2 [Gigaspora margarita]|uniref:22330_t:CDS:1 n=1 Tax=Gigaspora margarita TaxID=4874 RepID=A0ABN7UTA2_GIGMA|nr:22330_t:CDS:2 [Gigaspora margarita]
MNADNIFEIDSENSSFESQDILQNASDDNITTTIATTSNDVNITSNISNNPVTLNNKKSKSQPSPYSITTATGNLCKHLNTHYLSWNSDKQSGQQCLIFTSELTISNQILILAQKTKLNALIAKWIVSNILPFSVVSNAFIVIQKDVQTLLQKVSSKISITLDMWTSRTNMPFLCVMVHWIDYDWKLKKILLDIHMLPHSHTGKKIDEQLHAIFEAFDITTKILCATTDGAYLLNLIVTAGLAPIKSSIENVRNLVKAISSSLSITQDFRELEKSVSKSEAIRKISQDVLTRWNSTYLMLSVYLTMATTIVAIIRHNKSFSKYKLSLQKEADLQAATQFLQPFYETTNVLFGSTYATLVFRFCFPEFLKAATTQMFDKLQKYTDEIYDKIAFIAAILDSRIKLELIPADMNTEVNRAIFNNVFRFEYFVPILSNSFTNLETPSNLSYTEQIAQKKRNIFTNRTDEFTQYLNEAVLPMSVDPLTDYLAIQSTSVPSKQVFSKAGDTVRAKCTRLSEKSVQALMCVNSWLDHNIKFHK